MVFRDGKEFKREGLHMGAVLIAPTRFQERIKKRYLNGKHPAGN